MTPICVFAVNRRLASFPDDVRQSTRRGCSRANVSITKPHVLRQPDVHLVLHFCRVELVQLGPLSFAEAVKDQPSVLEQVQKAARTRHTLTDAPTRTVIQSTSPFSHHLDDRFASRTSVRPCRSTTIPTATASSPTPNQTTGSHPAERQSRQRACKTSCGHPARTGPPSDPPSSFFASLASEVQPTYTPFPSHR